MEKSNEGFVDFNINDQNPESRNIRSIIEDYDQKGKEDQKEKVEIDRILDLRKQEKVAKDNNDLAELAKIRAQLENNDD